MTVHKRIGKGIITAILAITLVTGSSLTAFGAASQGQETKETKGYVPGELLVMYKGDMTNDQVEVMAKEQGDEGASVIFQAEDRSIALVSLSDHVSVEKAVKEYALDPNVAAVTPNYEIELFAPEVSVNDPDYIYQDYLPQTRVPQAWNLVKGKPHDKVRVVVLDTGAELRHPDLTRIINRDLSKEVLNDRNLSLGPLKGDGFISGRKSNGGGHGTHVSGLVAAEANNGTGIAGAGSGLDNSIVELVSVDVFSGDRLTSIAHVIRGLLYAKSIGAKVINLSLGASGEAVGTEDKIFQAACDAVVASGGIIVSAAGNEGRNDNGRLDVIPSDFNNTISVIAVDKNNRKADISNYGTFKDISAPGQDIYSTWVGERYMDLTGTSMATAEVSGVVAMMCAVNPDLDAPAVKNILRTTATDLETPGFDIYTGMGLMNAEKAVKAALDLLPPTDSSVIPPADPSTEVPLVPPTDPSTEAPLVPPADPPAEAPLIPPTDPSTEAPLIPPTDPPTELPKVPPTNPPTELPKVPPTNPPAELPKVPPTNPPAELPKVPPINPPAESPVIPPEKPGIPVNPGPLPYSDVTEKDWYHKGVSYMYSRGIMTGLNPTVFGPANTLSRAQFATILHRMSGAENTPYSAKFPDVGEKDFYTSAVMWAANGGIIKGYENGNFGSSDTVTREQMAVMLHRYVQKLGKDSTARKDLSHFPDFRFISKFARDSMAWAYAEGIIKGNGNGTLAPLGNADRAASAVIMMRVMTQNLIN